MDQPKDATKEAISAGRVKTGVPGLDRVLGGGLQRGGIYLVMGLPGTGKTTLGNQICFAHAASGGRAVYMTLLAESHATMLRNLQSMSFFDAKAVNDSVVYVGAYRALRDDKLRGLLQLVRRVLADERSTLLVLDGLSPTRAFAESDVALKEFIVELQMLGAMTGCTTILLSNMTAADADGPEHTMVDGLIELGFERRDRRTLRTIEVNKLRGSAHVLGPQEMTIGTNGVEAFPRLEDIADGWDRPGDASGARTTTGIARLDEMLDGGLLVGTTTVVLGFTGAGKTTLGLQYLDAGAQKGEPGIYFGFYESPERILTCSAQLGMRLDEHANQGSFVQLWQPPYAFGLDALAGRLLRRIGDIGAKRLVIDGLDGLRQAATHADRTIRFLTALSNELRARNVTTLITDETLKMNGPEIDMRVAGTSALADGLLMLEYVTVASELRRLISVIKGRGTAHALQSREFLLTQKGLEISPDATTAREILSAFESAGGRVNRVPHR